MTLEQEIQHTLNRHSAENDSNTPDFILAQFLLSCLTAWNTGVQQRETWYGRDGRPSIKDPDAAKVIERAQELVDMEEYPNL